MKICVINYAHDPSGTSRNHVENQKRQNQQLSSLVDIVMFYDKTWLEKRIFYTAHREILDAKRGAGFWAWKPYIVLHTVLTVPSEVYIYLDSDIQIKSSLQEFAELTRDQPVVAARTSYRHSRYCKSLARQIIPCNEEPSYDLYAGVIAFAPSREAIKFLSDWMICCLNKSLIDDNPTGSEPPFPDFIAPRNDQTLFTRLYNRNQYKIYPPSLLKFTDLYPLPSFQTEVEGEYTD
jgi:hypothetical protein